MSDGPPTSRRISDFVLGMFCLLITFQTEAGSPAISAVTMQGTIPELQILSDMGVTNRIQTCTNLSQGGWVTLTNVVVTQSPYQFIDGAARQGDQRFYRVVQISPGTTTTPANMVLIPAGPFQMGDSFYEGATYELPIHTVDVSAFYMDKYEVTKSLWDQVM